MHGWLIRSDGQERRAPKASPSRTASSTYDEIPGLYKAGLSRTSVQRLFKAPRRQTVASKHYKQLVDARVEPKKNNARCMDAGTHYERAQQAMIQEWFAFYNQVNISGDDMNIIQVPFFPPAAFLRILGQQ
jgi:hypothetical protein